MKDLEERHVETQIERLRASAEAHRSLAAELEAQAGVMADDLKITMKEKESFMQTPGE